MKKLCRALYIDFNPDYITRIHEDCLILEDRGLIIEKVKLYLKPAREYLERNLPVKRIEFNTKRYYGPEGQRIQAWMVGGQIYFHDLDRCIAGRLTGSHTEISKEIVMTFYDKGYYEEILI
jgi:hypothetical protein